MVQLTASSSLNFLNSLIVCLRDYFCNVPQRWRRETRVFCSTAGTAHRRIESFVDEGKHAGICALLLRKG